MNRRAAATTFIASVIAAHAMSAPAFAQGTYASVALVGDVLRTSQADVAGIDADFLDGEAIGFGLRVGTHIGSRWGVELAFDRPGEIESELEQEIAFPLSGSAFTFSSLGGGTLSPLTSRSLPYTLRTRSRTTTLSTGVWVRQELSPRVSLAYIGGAGFHRSERELEFEFQPFIPIGFPLPIPIPPIAQVSESVQYDVRPFAGIESRIGLTEHTQLVPGIRLYGVDGGWLLRPAVAFGWVF